MEITIPNLLTVCLAVGLGVGLLLLPTFLIVHYLRQLHRDLKEISTPPRGKNKARHD